MAETNIHGVGNAQFQIATFNLPKFIDEGTIRNMACTCVDLNRRIAPEAWDECARIEGALPRELMAAAPGRAP